jgi:hypothetical protein
MMGSADALPEEPSAKTVFVEDMTEEQLASAVRHTRFYVCSLFFRGQLLRCLSESSIYFNLIKYQGNINDLIINFKVYIF